MIHLEVWCLESHLPVSNNWIIFIFHTEVPWQFTQEDWFEVIFLCFFVNNWMINPFSITRTIPEFNEVMSVLLKINSEILSYGNRLKLIRMRWWIKYASHWMDSISNNYDVWCISNLDCLINSISNCKQFCLSWCDIDSMVNGFCNNIWF